MNSKLVILGLSLLVGATSQASTLLCQNAKLQVGVFVNLTTNTAMISTWAPDFLELADGQPYQLTPQLKITSTAGQITGPGLDLKVKGSAGVLTAQTAIPFSSPIKNVPMVCKTAK